jgi:hypothetical protein
MPWNSAFLSDLDWIITVYKVFKGSSTGRFQVYWRWGKTGAFSFSTPLCTIRPYTARPSCKTLLSMKSAQRTKPQHRCLITRLFSILFWFNPVIWLYQKAILKIWIHRGQWSLIENFRQKSVSNHAFKITAHENCVALSNHFINH